MRAVVLREYGGPDSLAVEELPDPVPGPGQVLIEVAVAGITFVETQLRADRGPRRVELPAVLGNGVGGPVLAVGEGVDETLTGTRVVSTLDGTGGYAELAVAAADRLIPVPDGLPLEEAVTLLADGRTAVGLARAAAPRPGEWVLVEAAGGGVGGLLVQLASAAGARVVGAASSAAKRRHAASLGAELTVDYTDPDWTDQVRAAVGGPVDVVFDGVGGSIGTAAQTLLRDGGRLSSYGMAGGAMTTADPRVTQVGWPETDPRDLAQEALELAAAGRLRPTIGGVFPLESAAEAHAAIESRTVTGKSLLLPARARTILVTGATGNQGGAVSRALLDRGWAVRALVRDPDSAAARALAELGATLHRGDLDDPSSVRAAMTGVHGVFSVQPFAWTEEELAREVRQGVTLADLAGELHVAHLVYSSVGGAERDTGIGHFASKAAVERHIAGLRLPATILRPVFFMTNLLAYADPPGGERVIALPFTPGQRMQLIAAEDIGHFAAEAFDDPRRWIGRQVEIAGDALTGAEIAAAYERVTGTPSRFEPQPTGGERMYEWFRESGYQADLDTLRKEHPALLSFESFLRRRLT
ncbi:NmrA family NAD(P)-binding protein [Nonomuraea sp. NPDC047897]|uniref:NmrA family NAD(P)-binding protein n=1 Tax=Nonomuraea sp. NPDC047897 TaxID=3364346 RepID=UPI00371C6042